jgi:hypothetical protein
MTNRSLIIGKLPLTIQCMIENTLLHSILDTISKQIKQPWQVPENDCKFDLLRGLLEIMNGPIGNGQMKRQKKKVHLLT